MSRTALILTAAMAAALQAGEGQEHWAYRPIARPTPPSVQDADQVRNAVDAFVLARLDSAGLSPAPEADRGTLLRRLSFDLIGLPPTYEQVRNFEADTAPDAYENAVDRLLDSPLYGQRWGRHWLDVARYADTMGYNFLSDPRYPFAWTYRDYVIDAFNTDKPYDLFVREQIAADFLDAGDPRLLAAMGFLTVGRRFDFDAHGTIDDRIDVVTRGLMGLTVQCARCHDHKYDAITQEDYYALYGVFASSMEPELIDLPIIAEPSGDALARFNGELARRKQEVENYINNLHESIRADAKNRAAQYIDAARDADKSKDLRPDLIKRFGVEWQKAGSPDAPTPEQVAAIAEAVASLSVGEARAMITPAERVHIANLENAVAGWHAESPDAPARAMVMYDAARIANAYVFKRGQATNPGPFVPRRFLSALETHVGNEPFTQGSGRSELAAAVIHQDNPLTARVIANRVWQWHFGEGLVRTPSDFGVRGEPPTHPLLLDYLAAHLMDNAWSIKKLHRLIVTSATYRQSSAPTIPQNLKSQDTENRLLTRFDRRRLDFEAMRDAMLFAAGRLDTTFGGPSVELGKTPFPTRRAVYARIDRQDVEPTLRTFDFANPDASEAARPETTVPQQALFLLNAQFVAEQAQHIIARPQVAGAHDHDAKVQALYRILFARDPAEDEISLARTYIAYERQHHTEGQLDPWAKYTHALLISNAFMFVD